MTTWLLDNKKISDYRPNLFRISLFIPLFVTYPCHFSGGMRSRTWCGAAFIWAMNCGSMTGAARINIYI